jgi:type IV pilus assembly protein PilQ
MRGNVERKAEGGVAALVAFVLLVGFGTAWGQRALELTGERGRVEVHVVNPGSPTGLPAEAFTLQDPPRLVVEVPGWREPVALETATLPEGVRAARWSAYERDPGEWIARYVLELEEVPRVEVRSAGDRATVCATWSQREAEPRDDFLSPRVRDEAPPLPPKEENAGDWWRSDQRTMSLDVQGADIHAVLRSIAEFAGVNIVADKDVKGTVIIKLEDLPWPKVLDAVCHSQGLRALPADGVIRVATLKTVQNEELELEAAARRKEDLLALDTKVIPIAYAKASELRESLAFLLSQRGRLEVDERTNSLLVTDIPPRIRALEEMVRELDTETVQVEIRARLADVDETVARKLGINWNITNLRNGSVSGAVSGSMADVVDAAGELRLGIVDDFGQLDAVLQALEDQNKARIISSPSITTVSNRKARILVGKEVPLIVLDEAGNPTTELKKVGIALEVTPYVNRDGRITLDLHPEVSDLSSQATVQGGIVFTTTEADTRVMVDSGQTAVIGGLVREQKTRFERGIPILKDIPLLGYLFKRVEETTEKRELMIFVTPRVIRGVAGLEDQR